jgi:hypothetical protein
MDFTPNLQKAAEIGQVHTPFDPMNDGQVTHVDTKGTNTLCGGMTTAASVIKSAEFWTFTTKRNPVAPSKGCPAWLVGWLVGLLKLKK